jgi:hypothetical protein
MNAAISGAVAFENDDLTVEFDIERATRTSVTFRLRASNTGTHAVRCHVSTAGARVRAAKASLLELSVAPREVLDAAVEVRRSLAPSVVAEFTGTGLAVFVRAPDPALQRRRITRRVRTGGPATGGATAVAAVAALLVAVWLVPTPLLPRVEALSVPPSVTAGGDVQIAYALGGTSTGTYRLRDASGAVIDSGPVASSDGSLIIKAPASAPPGEYSVEVSAAPELAPALRVDSLESRAASFALVASAPAVAGTHANAPARRHRTGRTRAGRRRCVARKGHGFERSADPRFVRDRKHRGRSAPDRRPGNGSRRIAPQPYGNVDLDRAASRRRSRF